MKFINSGVSIVILIGVIIAILFALREESRNPEEIQHTYEPLYLNDTATVRNKVLTIFDSLGLTDNIEK